MVETNGTLSVLLKAKCQNATKQDVKEKTKDDGYTCPVIIDGAIIKKNLEVLEIKNQLLDLYGSLKKII